jgi:lipid-A-disaccharide synthase
MHHDSRPFNIVIPRLEITREFGHALIGFFLALPRQALSLFARKSRLEEFLTLKHDPLPDLCDSQASINESPSSSPQPPKADPTPPRIILACGDASGEAHSLRLIEALRKTYPNLQVSGFGGARLEADGMEVWQPLADLNVMGFKDVLAQLPLFFGCVGRFARELKDHRPDAVVLVDYPGLNRHLLRIAARAGVPVIDFIAPQLWAWAPWRVSDFRRADELLTILPFERDWFQRHGAEATYIGHPLGDGLQHFADAEADMPEGWGQDGPCAESDRTADCNNPSTHWVGILPGSRAREIEENLPALLLAAKQLQNRKPEVRFILPHLRSKVDAQIRQILASSEIDVVYAPGCFHKVLPHLRAAWVASGTALLEVAACGVPPVLVYGVSSRLGAWLSKNWLAVPWVGSLNLLAGKELAPEHLGRNLSPACLAKDLEERLDGPVRSQTLAEIKKLHPAFAAPGAAQRAAARIVRYLPARG